MESIAKSEREEDIRDPKTARTNRACLETVVSIAVIASFERVFFLLNNVYARMISRDTSDDAFKQ